MPRIFLTIVVIMGLLPTLAAQETPYGPKTSDRTELIHFGVYDSPPVVFPYEVIGTTRVTDNGRLDFRVVYRIPYEELVDALLKGADGTTEVAKINVSSGLAAAADGDESKRGLRIFGRQDGGIPTRFTLGSQHSVFRFVVDLSPDGANTAVQMRSAISSALFGGVVPARSPFAPVGANPIPFRWN